MGAYAEMTQPLLKFRLRRGDPMLFALRRCTTGKTVPLVFTCRGHNMPGARPNDEIDIRPFHHVPRKNAGILDLLSALHENVMRYSCPAPEDGMTSQVLLTTSCLTGQRETR